MFCGILFWGGPLSKIIHAHPRLRFVICAGNRHLIPTGLG